MKTLEYEDIPGLIRSQYAQEQILSASVSDTTNNVVVWVANPETKKQMEIEYSSNENRLLSAEERLSALPSPHRIKKESLSVIKSYLIEKDSCTLYEHYELRDTSEPMALAVASQIYYTPYRETEERIMEKLLKQVEQKISYSAMTKQQKAAYWSSRLYKKRRQIGESGGDEDAVFDKKLLEEMRKLDPIIEDILVECLRQLADMEQADYIELVEAFKKRTGCQPL